MEKDIINSADYVFTKYRVGDLRLGKWLSIDPIHHHSCSPYILMDNNPMVINDPLGKNGEVTIDQNSKEATVKANYYYNKNDPSTNKMMNPFTTGLNTVDLIGEYKKIGWESQDWCLPNEVTSDGDWSVKFEINFIGLDSDEAVNAALMSDPVAGNRIIYDATIRANGEYDQASRTVRLNKFSANSLTHEIGHSLGLPHAYFMRGGDGNAITQRLCDDDLCGLPGHNDNGQINQPIMSYGSIRKISTSEVYFIVGQALRESRNISTLDRMIQAIGDDPDDNLKVYSVTYNSYENYSVNTDAGKAGSQNIARVPH
ncbi:MAG: hypothetical protein ACK5XV_00460 [Flavobacteriales bacterium]